ncbi:MAG: cardiolipin synthase [Streptococcaceae bacterium]|jgi:cardiolipin synthase|nr:cardiolipin synthase [Streptococcaceae bacterium]
MINNLVILETILLTIQVFLSLIIIFRERKNTSSTWAWLFVVNIIPIFGFVLYLLIGHGFRNRKLFHLRDSLRPYYEREVKQTARVMTEEELLGTLTKNHGVAQLLHYLFVSEESLISTNTGATLYTDGREKFDALLFDIAAARHHIHLEYYIFKLDGIGREILEAAIAARKRGVEVRILIDAWGSRTVKLRDFARLTRLGGHVSFFFPSLIPLLNPRFNYRLHRKIAIIDGTVAYTGGFNIGDEYVTVTKKFGYWRDAHLRVTGDIVYSLQTRFLMDWNSQRHDELIHQMQDYFPASIDAGRKVAQFVSSGPDDKKQQVKNAYLKLINSAEREIIIQTPYYIPDTPIHDALKLALMSGVRVRLMIPNKPDHPFVYWATYFYSASLVKYGAEVYTYEAGFVHSKMLVMDAEVTSMGSTNFDNRSFQLDFEGNVIFYDREISEKLRADFEEDVKVSKQLTLERYNDRSYWIRFKEGLARLISPLL